MKILIVGLMLAMGLGAQTPNPGDQMVTVPKNWVQTERQAQLQSTEQSSPYLGIGKEIGDAVKGSLESVVEVSNKFADTPVGKFTLFILAWKLIGREMLGVLLGLPLYLAGIALWVWFARRFYFGRWIKVRNEQGKKEDRFEQPMPFRSNDAKTVASLIMVIILIAWNATMLNIIF